MCKYCKGVLNDGGTNKSLLPVIDIEYDGNKIMTLDTFITKNGELELYIKDDRDYCIKKEKMRISFCPICGSNLRVADKR